MFSFLACNLCCFQTLSELRYHKVTQLSLLVNGWMQPVFSVESAHGKERKQNDEPARAAAGA
jgi:hypothetical protein